MGFSHFIFDLYGTLVDIHTDEGILELWEALSGIYRAAGADYSPRELQRAYLDTVGELERGMEPIRTDAHEAHPEIKLELVFQRLYSSRGVEVSREKAVDTGREFRRLSTMYIRLYPGAAELLRQLRPHGRVWLLSNAQSIFTMDELSRLGITDLFDGIYLSSDYGVKKPDRRFFDVLLKARSIDPREGVMIGNDGLCDIDGARAAGLSTVYIRSNLSPREPDPDADFLLTGPDYDRLKAFLLSPER